jgi:hypothetical protein
MAHHLSCTHPKAKDPDMSRQAFAGWLVWMSFEEGSEIVTG